ncbi:MAG: DUF5060 domain-containing protein, partial [Candidatus Omnitrophica bacterium]|nr:DUF5060 domain-containing protein [Candidatus Omnitrophota bacterium]
MLAAASFLCFGAGNVVAEVHLEEVQAKESVIKLFERLELTTRVTGAIKNPYDFHEVSLEATFFPPHGQPVTVHGFYYEPFERITKGTASIIQPSGKPVWKVRFTPTQTGRWSYRLRLIHASGVQTREGAPFLVVPSSHRGFVRFNAKQGNFHFDTGESFIPIGENLCWAPSGNAIESYTKWFNALKRNRANYIRVWMAPWLLRLETKETGVGRYDQQRAWLLDTLLEQSQEAGIFWQLCLLNHGSFSRSQDADWHNNPYNEQLGGMCRSPDEFLTDPRAKTMFERSLRYITNRWGHSTQLMMWELFNEGDFGEFKIDHLSGWLKDMSRFLRSIDGQQRPITTSFHHESAEDVWQLSTIDNVQLHLYDQRDLTAAFDPKVHEVRQAFQKPVFLGEFGWIPDVMRKFDDIGVHFHEGLWSSLMAGAAGSALIWYWDSYVYPFHLERHFKGLEAFWRGEQIGNHTQRLEVVLSNERLAGLGLGNNKRIYLWIKNREHNIDQYVAYRTEQAKQQLRKARGEKVTPVTYAPSAIDGATAVIKGLGWMGRYRVEWWDPYRGRIIAQGI